MLTRIHTNQEFGNMTHTHTYNAAKNVQNPTKRKIQESENPIILRWKKPIICQQFQRSEY